MTINIKEKTFREIVKYVLLFVLTLIPGLVTINKVFQSDKNVKVKKGDDVELEIKKN
jgi:hypothetical protein